MCHCGYTTTPRASEQRALQALHSEHGQQAETCDICHRDRHDPGARRPFEHLRVITDPDNGDELLVCADDQQACNDAGRQLQVQLDRAAFDSLGIEMPRPRLRLIEGASGTHEQDAR
jgi:hypothetical protein